MSIFALTLPPIFPEAGTQLPQLPVIAHSTLWWSVPSKRYSNITVKVISVNHDPLC